MVKGAKISIIIPAYNYEDRVALAINSVLAQLDGSKHELIVINDGSTDNTSEILSNMVVQYAAKPFRVITIQNSGSAAVRNLGIQEAQSDYFIFLDADDELQPNALESIEHHLSLHPDTQMVIGGYTAYIECESKYRLSLPSDLPDKPCERVKGYLIDKTISLANGATLMHRSLFERGLYPEQFRSAEDLPVFAQALAHYRCSVLKKSLAVINRHDGSLRNNVRLDEEVGMQLVGEIFSSKRLPESCLHLRKDFVAQRALSMFRNYFNAKQYPDAKRMFVLAVKEKWTCVFKLSYLRKFLKILILNARR